ncbi:carbon-nitrogen hydrolase family protein [Mycoplasmatota bacterium WC30]
MKLLVIQNRVFQDIQDTLTNIKLQIQKADTRCLDFLVLPEMFSTPYELKYFKSHKQTKSDEVISFLTELASKYNIYIIGGSIPYYENDKIYNSTFVFSRTGEIISQYNKIHLFEITYPDGVYFREADVLTKGKEIVTFDTEFGIMGVMICFDIRFPLLADKLMNQGAKVIFVPAAFNTYTGPLHWRTTFRARSIDNQLFIVGCSPSNDSFGNYDIYGHSIVVNPYGEVLKELDSQRGVIEIDLDLKQIETARNGIPILKNRVKL